MFGHEAYECSCGCGVWVDVSDPHLMFDGGEPYYDEHAPDLPIVEVPAMKRQPVRVLGCTLSEWGWAVVGVVLLYLGICWLEHVTRP